LQSQSTPYLMSTTPTSSLHTDPSSEHTSAHFFLEGLVESGIEYLFCNLGTDHATLIEELAKFKTQGLPTPTLITCPHENVAIHMAGAYAAMTGKGQGVLVHVDAGTANAVMGMHNLMRSRLPVLLMAGRAPYTVRGELMGSRDNYVHFVQDPFDMASLVRPYTKWEYNLPSGVVSKEVLRRAHSVMHSDPPGPVFLSLPRETLAQHWPEDQVHAFSERDYGRVQLGSSSRAQLMQVAQQLLAAKHPIIMTSYAGRTREGFEALSELAQLMGIRVFEANPVHNNISRDHPWFCGFDASASLRVADLGLMIDVDVPWLPKYVQPANDTHWIHVDIDPLKKDFPLWGFASHTRIQANSAVWIEDLLAVLRPLIDSDHKKQIQARCQEVKALQEARAQKLALDAQQASTPGEVNPAHLMQTLSEMIAPEDVVVNEAIRHSPTLLNHLKRNLPKTLFASAGGGLGYSGGMALGFKLANPQHRVIQIVGDGGFHFSTPTSVYAVAQAHGLAIFTVVLDNGGWQAVKEATLRVHPQGFAAQSKDFHAKLEGEHRHFEMVGAAFGAHAERVNQVEDLKPAIERSLQALDHGQSVVMVVSIPKL
jgi:acetolactate synthase I/II/III large subunit